jgi:hypothetical protein
VPVVRDGSVAYVLTAIVNPESFDRLFAAQGDSAGWASGLLGREGNFIARASGRERPRGTRAGEQFLAAIRSGDEGWYRGRTVDGLDTYTAFTVVAADGNGRWDSLFRPTWSTGRCAARR